MIQTFSYSGSAFKTVTLFAGVYKLECWGASGVSDGPSNTGGKGAYVSGVLKITKKLCLFVYLGEKGKIGSNYTFNGGGQGQYTGGGATDFRLESGTWDSFSSLKSRIIVAGGGGGPDFSDGGGSGGALIGKPSKGNYGKGGSQTSGGEGHTDGSFGIGGGHRDYTGSGNGGGGGGYYGGGSSTLYDRNGGGGGSSFISGYVGCNAICRESTSINIVHSNQSFHYSGLSFKNSVMIDGDRLMPSPLTDKNITGNDDNGFARITQISIIEKSCNANIFISFRFSVLTLLQLLLTSENL